VISYLGESNYKIIEPSNSPQQFRPPPWSLPGLAWGLIVVKQNLLFRMDPCSSTGKWSLEYAERISHTFSHGDKSPMISGKL
jgi:hypothetical protein